MATTKKVTTYKSDDGIKSLYENGYNYDSKAVRAEYIEFNGRKFRLYYGIHNGSVRANTNVAVMTTDGTWECVFTADTANVSILSYVCAADTARVDANWKEVRAEFIKFIKAVYA